MKPRALLLHAVLSFVLIGTGQASEAKPVIVNLGWAELVETTDGWRLTSVHELGDWNLPLRESDVIVEIDGRDASQLGPLSIASFLEQTQRRKVRATIRRGSETLEFEIVTNESLLQMQKFYNRHGIGIAIYERPDPPGAVIGKVMSGGPAERAGLKAGDEIVAVGGKEVQGLSISQVSGLLVSDNPVPVRVRVRRGIDEFEVEVQRTSTSQLFKPPQLPPGRSSAINKRVDPAPSFRLPDPSGKLVSGRDFPGRWVLLNFWGVWCQPCRLEIPQLNRWAAKYSEKLVILGLDLDDTDETLRQFLAKERVSFKVLIAGASDGPVAKDYSVGGPPWNVLISPEGRVQYVEVGFLPGSPLEEQLKRFVGPPPQP